GDLPDSSLVSVKLADNRRVVVAAPWYLRKHGTPRTPRELTHHNCLTLAPGTGQDRGWLFRDHTGQIAAQRVKGDLACNDGSVLLEWVRAGRGLSWRSLWEVRGDLRVGNLVSV